MLIVDASNIMHSGADSRDYANLYNESQGFRCCAYFMSKVVNFALHNKNLVVAFDPEKESKAVVNVAGYKSNRLVNPQVEWELRVLRRLLSMMKVPMLEAPGYEADCLIHSALVDCNDAPENHFIVSADQDLTCDVRARGKYTNSTLSFNSRSYNITPENFQRILKVPYNFINVYKLCMGCKSDTVPAYPNGRRIFDAFIYWVEEQIFEESGCEFESINDIEMVFNTFDYNTEECFFEWLTQHQTTFEATDELYQRARLIFPKYKKTDIVFSTDWEMVNSVNRALFRLDNMQFHCAPCRALTAEENALLKDICTNTPLVKTTVFTPSSSFSQDEISQDLAHLSIFESEEIDL